MVYWVAVPLFTVGTGGLLVLKCISYKFIAGNVPSHVPGAAVHSKVTFSLTGTFVAFGKGLMYCTQGGVARGRYAQTLNVPVASVSLTVFTRR